MCLEGQEFNMRAVIQRVKYASVRVDNNIVGNIEKGYMVLLGIEKNDTDKDLEYIVNKTINLRVFEDENQKMNLSIKDVNGSILAISQFTLLGDVRHGNRPSFIAAELPEKSIVMYDNYCHLLESKGISVERGIFGADMKVELLNDGPVTILLDSKRLF